MNILRGYINMKKLFKNKKITAAVAILLVAVVATISIISMEKLNNESKPVWQHQLAATLLQEPSPTGLL